MDNIDRWLRLERAGSGAGISLYIGRKRNSQINRSSPANTANQSSEKVEEELMKLSKVVGRKWMTGLMKLSKVVVHKVNVSSVTMSKLFFSVQVQEY